MSKAFLRESDFSEPAELPSPIATLPPGAKNDLTPDGAERLRAEAMRLLDEERPKWTSSPESSDARQTLQAIDQRVRSLFKSLRTAEVISPPAVSDDHVRFGAFVTVREKTGTELQYRVVGVDEIDLERGWVSWISPLAKALMNARKGQRVILKAPRGQTELEIVAVRYE